VLIGNTCGKFNEEELTLKNVWNIDGWINWLKGGWKKAKQVVNNTCKYGHGKESGLKAAWRTGIGSLETEK